MRRVSYAILILLLLVGVATALDPVNVAVRSSSDWVTANNVDSAMITVKVTDGTGNAIHSADVTLAVTDPWILEKTDGKTDGAGLFETRFLPTLKSGTAVITASVEVKGVTTIPVVQTYSQNISHDTPAEQAKSYVIAATLGSTTEISVLVKDAHGNPVDSRRKVNNVAFSTTLSGTGGFVDDIKKDKVKGISVRLDKTGTAATDFVLDTKPGPNYVSIDPPDPLPPTLISIQGVPDEKPAVIFLTVDPEGNPPTLTTGTSRFLLEYQLEDSYGNPSAQQDLSITTTAGESLVITSNNEGRVTVTYGPKTNAGKYTVTATAVKNPAVVVSRILQFASDDPTDMLLTATPQSMPSLDVDEKVFSSVMAKVIDTIGNPVRGQVVSFSIQSVDVGSSVQTSEPYLEIGKSRTEAGGTEITAVTDENGYAIAEFIPGTFAEGSPMAEGIARVRAVWGGVPHDIDLSYKNYPYLSVSTSVDPMTVETGDEVKVSIRLRGDGYALIPKPVDVYLVTDRSGSMGSDTPTRISQLKNAATIFTTKFDYTSDRLGQFSFGGKGGKYSDYATLDQKLTDDMSKIQSAISALTSSGYTPMRYALYKAITELSKNGRSGTIKALVVMSDGDYNNWGDPLARGNADKTGKGYDSKYQDTLQEYIYFSDLPPNYQNMAEYARANNIRIYTIGYAEDISPVGMGTLEQLATSTDGKYFYALDGDQLAEVYSQIAGELKEVAGVNTHLNLDFQNVEVNTKDVPGAEVFEYVSRDGESTYLVPPLPRAPWTENSQAAWDTNHQLSFDLGTIKIGEEWSVEFRLKVITDGNIKVLGANSQVVFDEGKGTLTIPDTYLTSIPEGKQGGLGTLVLDIWGLEETIPRVDEKIANLRWNIDYNGNDEDILEEIWLAPLNSNAFAYKGTRLAKKGDTSGSFPLDISILREGSYKVRVIGIVDDAKSDFDEMELIIQVAGLTPQILIE